MLSLCAGVAGAQELKDIDPLEASMLLDQLFKKVAPLSQPTRAAPSAPLSVVPSGAGRLAEEAGCPDIGGAGGMIRQANQEIAADIARRCVFDISPLEAGKRVRQHACVQGVFVCVCVRVRVRVQDAGRGFAARDCASASDSDRG
jgi:hypothetical protein